MAEQKQMSWISVGRADIETTELGAAAFDGKIEVVRPALVAGVSWATEGTHLLHAAIYGGHLELAQEILRAGSPLDQNTYYISFDYLPQMLERLPANPELMEKIEASRRWPAFARALVDEDVDLARKLLQKGVPIQDRILISHGMGNLCPIHYAVRSGNMTLIRMLVVAGADVNALSDKDLSPLRMVAQNTSLGPKQRKEIIHYLQSHGAQFFPPIESWKTKIALWLGRPISERD